MLPVLYIIASLFFVLLGKVISANKTKEVNKMASKKAVVPEAKNALNNMKYEIANEMGVNLKQGYNGDITSKQAGSVGGEMVKRLINQAKGSK